MFKEAHQLNQTMKLEINSIPNLPFLEKHKIHQ